MLWITICLCVLGGSLSHAADSEDDGNTFTLPPEFDQKFNSPDSEKLKTKYLESFKKKCEENNHPEAFETAQQSINVLMKCIQSQVDIKVLESEIEEARPEGSVDEVFKRYCNKSPYFKECLVNMTKTMEPCFTADEQKQLKTFHNITSQLGEFICHKDGERIALFIAEGGKECFQFKQTEVQNCFNETFDQKSQDNIKDVVFNFVDSPLLKFEKEQCEQLTKLQKCVVGALQTCDQPTTANIVESLFKFIRKSMPCTNLPNVEKKAAKTNSSPGLSMTTATLVTSLIALLIV